MAPKKRNQSAKEGPNKAGTDTEPRFPYTTKPSSLRRLLQEIPNRPRPPKFDTNLLRSWGFKDGNDYTMLRVLKAVSLLNAKNEPTDLYSQYRLGLISVKFARDLHLVRKMRNDFAHNAQRCFI